MVLDALGLDKQGREITSGEYVLKKLKAILVVDSIAMRLNGGMWLEVVNFAYLQHFRIEVKGEIAPLVAYLKSLLIARCNMDEDTAYETINDLFPEKKSGLVFIHNLDE